MRNNNIEVYIKCENRALPEYQVEVVDDKTVACYIPSEVGKTFCICWASQPRLHDKHVTTVRPRIDGHLFGGQHYRPGSPISGYRDAVQTSRDQERLYTFAVQATTDDDDDDIDAAAGQLLDPGTIEVQFAHVKECGWRAAQFPFDCDAARTVHEKSKKLGAHCVSFKEPRACLPQDTASVSKLVNEDEPFYTRFVFRYRPKDLLRAQGIIPMDAPAQASAPNTHRRSTSKHEYPAKRSNPDTQEAGPSRKKAKTAARPRDDEPGEDTRALEAELEAIHARARAIQEKLQAKHSGANSPLVRVKREREAASMGKVADRVRGHVKKERAPIRLPGTSGEVIDLTLD